MSWYRLGKTCLALRKHVMRVDLHTHCGEEQDFNNPNDMNSSIKAILTSAIVKGLDVVGVISHFGPQIGYQAAQIASQEGLDLWVLPGEEYLCTDKFRLLIYLLKEPMPPNLGCDQAIQHAHKNGGFVMAINLSKRQISHLNKNQGTEFAPDAIEIYNAVTGGYKDISTEYPKFVSSAAKSAKDMEQFNAFTLIERKHLEGLGLLPEGQGEEYTPGYLQKADELEQDATPQDVADGKLDQALGDTSQTQQNQQYQGLPNGGV